MPYLVIDSVTDNRVAYSAHFSEKKVVAGVARFGQLIDLDTGMPIEEEDEREEVN